MRKEAPAWSRRSEHLYNEKVKKVAWLCCERGLQGRRPCELTRPGKGSPTWGGGSGQGQVEGRRQVWDGGLTWLMTQSMQGGLAEAQGRPQLPHLLQWGAGGRRSSGNHDS